MTKHKNQPTPDIELLRHLPQGLDNDGRTLPRAQTIPAKRGAGSYRRKKKHSEEEE